MSVLSGACPSVEGAEARGGEDIEAAWEGVGFSSIRTGPTES